MNHPNGDDDTDATPSMRGMITGIDQQLHDKWTAIQKFRTDYAKILDAISRLDKMGNLIARNVLVTALWLDNDLERMEREAKEDYDNF